jgi:dTDP-4-dehydrorhamnose 3,5-epimerase
MKLSTRPLAIPDVVLLEHETYDDERGFFMEVYRQDQFRALGLPDGFVQMNQSRSKRNVVRGLHFQWQPPMAKLMRVSHGAAFLVAVDIRHDSPTLGQWVGQTLTSDTQTQLWAPAGFARGFCALSDTADVQYLCTAAYNPAGEAGIAWNDPEIGIQWPVQRPLLSPKDATAISLRDWLATSESKRFSVEAAFAQS